MQCTDDFSIVGDSFDLCLSLLAEVLRRCEDCNLMLNWEKCKIRHSNRPSYLGQGNRS